MKKIEINSLGEACAYLIFLIAVIFALLVFQFWLWKVIAVEIFCLPALNFWQFIGLKILLRELFGNFYSNDNNLIKFKMKEEE